LAYINRQGKLFVIGKDKLGLGTLAANRKRLKPILNYVPMPKNVKSFRSVKILENNMACITDKGKLYGSSFDNILVPIAKDTPLWNEYIAEVEQYGKNFFVLTEDGNIWVWGHKYPNHKLIDIKKKVIQITKTEYLTEDGKVYSYRVGDYLSDDEEAVGRNFFQRILYDDETDPAEKITSYDGEIGYGTDILTKSKNILLFIRGMTSEEYEDSNFIKLTLPERVQPVDFDTSANFLAIIDREGNIYYWSIESSIDEWMIGKVPDSTFYLKADEIPGPVKHIMVKDVERSGRDNIEITRIFLILDNEDIYTIDVGDGGGILIPFIKGNKLYYAGIEHKLS
jgi:alpha-tubulin suppressor-like RCC1 family protein